MMQNLTIGIAGSGGDGVVTMGTLLQRIAAIEGYYSQMPRYYGPQIRGGGSAVKLGLNSESLSLPADVLDVLVCFDWGKYFEVEEELSLGPDTIVLHESDPDEQIDLPVGSHRVGFTERSKEASGSSRNKNLLGLGLLLEMLGFEADRVGEIVESDGHLHLVKDNWEAVAAGIEMKSSLSLPDVHLSPPGDTTPKEIIHGNSAVAQAALRAGCKAYFGYPLTPSAEIMQEMQKELPDADGVFLQAEDEIATVGMMVGASMAGVKAMTATSGPGIDLMTEMLGLGVMAEVPMVIVDVQRCGPSTGIPSKSEQSDLNHAIYGGHGDSPRVVLAPCDVEGCYRLTIESFSIAEHYQVPVVLLSDQWLGQTFVATDGAFLEKDVPLPERKRPTPDDGNGYHRFLPTEDFISPMANLGDPGFTYRASGLTHDGDGAPSFGAELHQELHNKRWDKLRPLVERDDLVAVHGDAGSRRGVLTWGSSAQVVRDALTALGLGSDVKVCVPELIHPLPRAVEAFAESVDELLVVEMNHSGQLYRYARSQIDLPRRTLVYCRSGGRPFAIHELETPLQELIG